MKGYGRDIPDPKWPGGAHVAVQFVLNYEEGGENNTLHGDATSEAFLSEIVGATPWVGQRHWNMESIYEYGARAGFWRLWRMFTGRKVPLTIYGVATAMQRSPEQVQAMMEAGWEIASHGLKWVEHKDMPEEVERAAIKEAIRIHTEVTGKRPLGWYTGRSSMNPTKLVMEEGGFLYSSDDYADDLPRDVEMLSESMELSVEVQSSFDSQTETWGVKVTNVEIRTVEATDNMVRAIAKQAKAEPDRRARVIHPRPNFRPGKHWSTRHKSYLQFQPLCSFVIWIH